MTSLPSLKQLLQQALPIFLTSREQIRIQLFIRAQIAIKPQKVSLRVRVERVMAQAGSCLNRLHSPPLNCHQGCAAESGTQVTSAA